MRTMRGRTQDAAALHLRERMRNDVDNDNDDDGDDAAECSAFVTFRLTHDRVCTQVVHTSPGMQPTARTKNSGLRLLEAPSVSVSACEQRAALMQTKRRATLFRTCAANA